MRKQLSLLTLTLFLLFMGAGTSWANFWSNGQDRGTWTLTNFSDFGSRQNLINTLKTNNWSPTGTNQNTWRLTDESGNQVTYFEGAGHMKVSGTVRLTIQKNGVDLQGDGLVLHQDASISIDCNQYYAVEVTAKANSGTIDCNWSNVRSTPESPQFTTTEKTQTVLFSGNEQGWVTMTNPTNKQLTITEIKMYPKPTLLWTKNGTQVTFDKMNLIDLDYTEPTLEMAQIPSNANVWLTIDEGEGSIVTFNNDAQPSYSNGTMTYDLMGLDVGFATITAHATWNGGSLEASYRLRVDIDEYLWEMEGYDKYKITGEGAILNPVVDAVPYITMTYGNPDNTSMVRNLDNNLVATIIDEWGWRHVRCYNGNNGGAFGLPWQGTFYKFEPQIDGDLTVWMRLYNQWGQAQAVIVDANNLNEAYKRYYNGQNNGNINEYETVHLIGGHTYYLYGIVNEPSYLSSSIINGYTQWTAAELNAFKFAPNADLIYNHKGVVYKDGKFYDIDGTTELYNEARQPIAGGRVEYALEFYPSEAEGPHASIDNSGKLTIDPDYGGAIAVKATVKNQSNVVVNRDYYIVTVPYKTHDWWFTESVDPQELIVTRPSQQKQDFCTWGIAYKVLRPELKWVTINGQSQQLRMRKEVKDPVLCSTKGIKGNNAGYAIQTAGLLINASAKRFGVNTDMSYVGLKQTDANGNVITVNDANGIPIDQYIDDWNTDQGAIARDAKINEYAYNKTIADTYGYPTTYITMATTSTLIIPNLLEGQHIRIYWARHNTDKGDKYTATGVTDLEGRSIDGAFWIGNGSGYTEFIAKGGNATFTLDDQNANTCWTNIYRITVGEVGEFLETHLNTRLGNIAYNPQPSSPSKITSNGSVTYRDITPYQVESGETMTIWGPMRNFNTPYETSVTDGDGTITYTLTGKENVGLTSSLTRQYKIFKDLGKLAGTGEVTYDGDKTWNFRGNGIVAVVINGSSNGYVLDTDTLNMAYGTVHPQTYPHTWDFTRIGRNTNTKTMLSNAYQNGFGDNFNWIKKNQWGDPNTKTESNYKMWEPATDVEGEYILNGYDKELKTTFFAQGSELSANFVPIEETKGLGIYLRKGRSGSYFLYSMANDAETSFTGHDMLRYGTVDEGTGAEDGSGYLKFPAEETDQRYIIRVPNVSKSNDQRVYICADGTPTVYQEEYANNGNGSDSDITTLAANSDGNNSYFVPENDGDVFIDVTGLKVFKIGVTNTYKPLKTYGSKSYATESRHHNERYDLSGYFTGDEVLAYKATSFTEAEGRQMIEDDDNDGVQTLSAGKLNLEPVDVADANTGVILIGQTKAEDGHFSELPLFVKDVNSNITSNEGNLLKPVFVNGNGASNWGSGTNYILTRSYTNPSGQSVTGPLAFYKATNITPSMSKYQNLAFLDLTGLISEDGGNSGNNGGSETVLVEKTVTYALGVGDSFTSGQTVNVENEGATVATITYGENGGNTFTAAVVGGNVPDFPAYTAGNGTNGNSTGGTFYTITPTKDGTIVVAVVLNADKNFYILENGTPLDNYNGITVNDKYYGTYTFQVTAGKSYKIYCSSSKLGFYGFKFTYEEAATSSANYDMFWFIDEEEDLDGIENISLEEILAGGVIETENAVYYNLSGQKLSGKPSQKGIYICNGKKIYVK